MTIPNLVFLLAVFATFFNNALHWYTHVTTYPLFAWIGQNEFVSFHKEYERRLPLSIYLPYTAVMASTLLLLFWRPEAVALGWVIMLLVLQGSIMAVSLAFAAPLHAQLDREGKQDAHSIGQLLTFNGTRLAAATICSLVMAYLLFRVLGTTAV